VLLDQQLRHAPHFKLLRYAKFVPGRTNVTTEYTEASQPYGETTASYIFTNASAIMGPLPPYAVDLLPMQLRRRFVEKLSPPRPLNSLPPES
jgi:hypothetical protein